MKNDSKKFIDVNSVSECLTCPSEPEPYKYVKPSTNQMDITESTNCLYYSASFSLNANFYALECRGDRLPITYIKSTEDKTIECKQRLFLLFFYLEKLLTFVI